MEKKYLYEFGDFSLCTDENILRRNGEHVSLTPKMFDLLLTLVRNHGKIVEKDFLLRTVWPDSFVENCNITFNIRQLRKVLNDDAQQPSYIETVPRRGYRFIAVVEEILAKPATGTPLLGVPHYPSSKSGRLTFMRPAIWLFPVFALFICTVVAGLWLVRSKGLEGAPVFSVPYESRKLSTDGQVLHAAISPDGKAVVYSRRNGGNQSLWVRQLDTSNNIQIVPSSEFFYYGLTVSPDSGTVYFVRGEKPRQGSAPIDIFRISIFGGVPQKIAGGTEGWISISPDGEKISYVRCPRKEEEYCSLWIADSLDGKNERRVVSRPRPIRIGGNKISSDGRTIAFAVGQSATGSNEFGLAEVDIESGAERELTSEKFFNIKNIAWLPDKTGLFLTARKLPDKNYRIIKVSALTGETTKLTTDSESYSGLSLDTEGTILLSSQVQADFHLSIYSTDDVSASPRVLTNASGAAFAQNGKIFFSSMMTGDHEIWSVNPDGSEQRQITNNPADDVSPIVSTDNNSVFFASNRTGELQVWRMDQDGGGLKQVTSKEGGFPIAVSPNGRWLYYTSGLRTTLRRVRIDDGQEEQMLNEVRPKFAVSPDCQWAAFSEKTNEGNVLAIISLDAAHSKKSFRIAEPFADLTRLAWSKDGKYIAYVLFDERSGDNTLWFQTIDKKRPNKIVNLGNDEFAELGGLSLSPDGKTFAVVRGNWNHNTVLFENLK